MRYVFIALMLVISSCGIAVAQGKSIASLRRMFEYDQSVPLDVKEGDRVLFGKYAGNEIKLDGDEYLIMREDDILGIIERGSEGSKSKKANK